MRGDSCTHDWSGSAVILEFRAGRELGRDSFGIGADLAVLETIDAVIAVACGKFPAVAGQGFSRGGQGTFLARQRFSSAGQGTPLP